MITTLLALLLPLSRAEYDPADRCRKLPGEIERQHDLNCDWVLHKGNKYERWYRCECREVDEATGDVAGPAFWFEL